MIKNETKYIIRRILIGVGIALILSFIKTCQVKAETFTIESKNTTLKMYNYSGTNTLTKSYDGLIGNGAYFSVGGNSDPIIKLISGANFTHNNVKIVLFNFKVTNNNQNVTNNVGINSVSFMGNTCHYTEEYPTIIQQGGTNPTETQPALYASVICALNTNINYTTNNPILEISMSGNPKSTIYFSNITIVTDVDNTQILSLLNTINGNLISSQTTLQNLYNRIVDLIATTQTNTADIINSFRTIMEGQTTSITNAQNQTTTAVNGMNDTLNNSNVDAPNDSISNMNSQIGSNSVISDLLLLPVRFYQTILNSVNSTCTPYTIGSLFNTNITLPCVNIEDILGSTIYSIIDIGLCGIFVFSMRKKFVSIFENITSLKDRGNELE